MKTSRVVFGKVKTDAASADRQDSGFIIEGDDSSVDPSEHDAPPPTVNPIILGLLPVALIFLFSTFFFTASKSSVTPIWERIRSEKILEQYKTHYSQLHPDETPESIQKRMDSVQNGIHAVARAEALGNKALTAHELNQLMLLDRGDTQSPLFKFCLQRSKEYR